MNTDAKETGLIWLTLFASGGTLICCALHKTWVFAGSGSLLLVSGWLMYRPGRTCPTNPELNQLCDQTQVWNRRIFWSSATLWGIGFFAAYLALPLRMWLDA